MRSRLPSPRTQSVALFLGAFGFLLPAVNPAFYLDDSPETAVAGVLLGIPHPPGYPLHTALASLFARLPLGAESFRVNLFSSSLAALGAVLLFRLLLSLRVPAPASFAGGALGILGAAAYPAALSAKGGVYHGAAALLLGLLLSLRARRYSSAALLAGASLAHHWMSLAALAPGLAVLAWKGRGGRLPSPADWARAAALLALGASPYLLLPLRARFDPLLNWGDPDSLNRFLFNFLRTQYAGAEGTGGPADWLRQAFWCLETLFREHAGAAFLAAVPGAFLLRRSDKDFTDGCLLALGGLVASVSFYLHLEEDRRYLIDAYLLTAHGFTLMFALAGAARLLEGRPRWGRLAGVLLLSFSAALGAHRVLHLRQTHHTISWDYVLNLWKGVPRDALLFARGDSVVFPSWYFQYVRGLRPDLPVVGLDGLPMEWVRRNLKRLHPALRVPFPSVAVGRESIPGLAALLIGGNPDRPVHLSYNRNEDPVLPGGKPVPAGMSHRLPREGEEAVFDEERTDRLWASYRFRRLWDGVQPLDGRTRALLVRDYAVQRNSLGVYHEDAADALPPEEAARRDRHHVECLEHFLWAARLVPEDAEFAYNVGNAQYRLGRLEEAALWYARSRALDPRYAPSYYNGAVVEIRRGNWKRAGELLERALELDPGHAQAREALSYLQSHNLY